MEDIQIVDKDGKIFHMSEIIRSFLKDHLRIQVSTNKEYDYGNEYTVIDVRISLDGEEICQCSDSIR